jgi:hypothetical protein
LSELGDPVPDALVRRAAVMTGASAWVLAPTCAAAITLPSSAAVVCSAEDALLPAVSTTVGDAGVLLASAVAVLALMMASPALHGPAWSTMVPAQVATQRLMKEVKVEPLRPHTGSDAVEHLHTG